MEKFVPRVSWNKIQNFPQSFSFEGEIAGYLSVFKTGGEYWHVYLYESREALIEHEDMSFLRVDDIEFRSALNINFFVGNEKLLRFLDRRYVRISGVLRVSETSISNIPFYVDTVYSMKWRGEGAKWTSEWKKDTANDDLTSGRLLAFPEAVFFEHSASDDK